MWERGWRRRLPRPREKNEVEVCRPGAQGCRDWTPLVREDVRVSLLYCTRGNSDARNKLNVHLLLSVLIWAEWQCL